MTEYDNTNRFALFVNDQKNTDKHPDYSGTLNVNGVEYWISAWKKDGRRGKFLSGSIKLKENNMAKVRDEMQSGHKPAPQRKSNDFIDDDLPF